MEKSSDAFRTISEVADDLALPQHVLRFWETRFPHIKPMKRAGGRRYYRPADVVLLRTIRQLLYDEGYTIKGVQRLLKEQGARSFRSGAVPAPPIDLADTDDGEPRIALQPVSADDLDPQPEASLEHGAPLTDDHREALIETLALVDECTQILESLRRSQA